MNKGKNFDKEQITVEALGASIVSFLLKEGKVVIPELGYLELKNFPDKQTVLYKATENATLFLASEDSVQFQIYNQVSVPLKEGKIVALPELGIFRPMKNADGSYRVSFTISSALRKLLNETKGGEKEAENPELPVAPINITKEKIHTPVIESVIEKEREEEKRKEEEENKVEIIAPKQEIKVTRKTTPSHIRSTSKVGDLVVPQEGKEKNETKLGIIIAAIAAIVVLAFIVWYFMPENRNKKDRAFVSGHGKTESAQVIDQSKGSLESHELIDLPSLAERKYGNRIFWVYIYEANRDKISSPVNIPAGTNLRIPNLWDDYKVDVMDSMEIKRAGILSDIVLKTEITTLKK